MEGGGKGGGGGGGGGGDALEVKIEEFHGSKKGLG